MSQEDQLSIGRFTDLVTVKGAHKIGTESLVQISV